jgi:hypothetical protein
MIGSSSTARIFITLSNGPTQAARRNTAIFNSMGKRGLILSKPVKNDGFPAENAVAIRFCVPFPT